MHVEFATAPGDDSLIIKAQLQAAEGDFESCRTFIVSDEQIRSYIKRFTELQLMPNSTANKLSTAKFSSILEQMRYNCA